MIVYTQRQAFGMNIVSMVTTGLIGGMISSAEDTRYAPAWMVIAATCLATISVGTCIAWRRMDDYRSKERT